MDTDIRTSVQFVGQPYVDKPIYAAPNPDRVTPIAEALADIFGNARWLRNELGVPKRVRVDIPQILLRHERTQLKWMKPDGKGGLVPR